MKRCYAVVNSSVSEGMSAAILEVNICKRVEGEKCFFFSRYLQRNYFFTHTHSAVNAFTDISLLLCNNIIKLIEGSLPKLIA